MSFTVNTQYPLAAESPDHLNPHGTKNMGTSSPVLIAELERMYGDQFHALALGCSGGKLVSDLVARGHEAVGLEGSDYHIQKGTAHWKRLHNTRLFTCDISQPFKVLENDKPAKFDVITLWDVFEHIAPDRIACLMDNIHRHLKPEGLLLATICLRHSPHPVTGVELHLTVKPREWWLQCLGKRFIPTGKAIISVEAWDSVTCWHGKNKDQNWATRIAMRPR